MSVHDTQTPDPSRKPISRRLRFEILRRDNYTCRYCGGMAPDVKLTVDHVIPTTLGGDDEPSNLITACWDCNAGKGSTSPDEHIVAEVSEFAEEFARAMAKAAEIERSNRGFSDPMIDDIGKRWDRWGINADSGRVPVWRSPQWRQIIAGYVRSGLNYDDLDYAIDVSMHREDVANVDKWRYFCGVCRTMVANRQEIARGIIEKDGGN